MTATLATTASIAESLNTTPRELRKFLRSKAQGVGKGSRYALPATKTAIAKMRKEFDAWTVARDSEAKAKTAKGVSLIKVPKVDEVDEVDADADDNFDPDLELDGDLDDLADSLDDMNDEIDAE